MGISSVVTDTSFKQVYTHKIVFIEKTRKSC